ncbi:radical SAM protein [Bradyrhizobium sp.]|uniref:radical SAM protein n=1 Tax=Bradyrhizobium sp. TaxID=376 RepID=UPI0039E2D015
MNYSIEADWHLLDTCNYRCGYCFFGPETLGAKLRTFSDPSGWGSAFDETGAIWLLHLTGGEPSIYPDFATLCERLTARHYISLNSNLTHASLADLPRVVDPSRVSFINAGLHLEERELRKNNAPFLRNAETLRAADFPLIVSLVATPSALRRFDDAIALLAPIGLFPVPKLFRGSADGKIYPQAYTEQEKQQFRLLAARARDFYQADLLRRAEPPSIDILNDDLFLDGMPSYKGALCTAGVRFVQILPNGDVRRCGGGDPMGNILARTFARRAGPAPCDTQHCYYFCNKYSDAGPQRDGRTMQPFLAAE